MRLGWPDFCIRQAVIKSDPVEWMLDLVEGRDTVRMSDEVAVGVVIAHGDFPKVHDMIGTWEGYPIYGITQRNFKHLHLQMVMYGKTPKMVDGKVKEVLEYLTAGNYVMVVTGTGETVSEAAGKAYKTAKEIAIPSNLMYRDDIGEKLEEQLPLLQKHGYAVGMKYG
jgi:phosphoribosylamine--glycine ligase